MSSFICSNKHFASIAKGILCIINTNNFHVSYNLKQISPQIYGYKRTSNEKSAMKDVWIKKFANNVKSSIYRAIIL